MSDLVSRLQSALNFAGLSWSRASQEIGLSPQAPSKWKKGQISKETLENLAKLTKVDFAWLATGQGSMTINNGISVGGNNTNTGTQIGQQNNYDNATAIPSNKIKVAPLINSIQAGEFTSIGDDTYDEYLPYFGDYGNDNVYWLRIEGKSMLPDFREGEFVLINKDRQPTAGNYVAAIKENEDKATFKKYRPKGFDDNGKEYWQLIPSNEEYPIIDSRYQPFVVIGVAVERNQRLV